MVLPSSIVHVLNVTGINLVILREVEYLTIGRKSLFCIGLTLHTCHYFEVVVIQLFLIVGQCLCVPVEVTVGRFCKRVVGFAALEAGSTFRVTIRGDRILIVMVILGDITWSGLN